MLAAWLTASACGSEPAATLTATPADIARGRALYLANCSLCHGERADGRGVRHAGFARPPRDLTSPLWQRTVTPDEVRDLIRHGKRGTPMPGFPSLDPDEIDAITAYVLSLGAR